MSGPAESAARKLALEMGSWTSIEFRLSEQFENKNPQRAPSEATSYQASLHYVETATGQRLYEHRMNSNLYPGETLVSIDYTDGTKCAFLSRNDQGDQPGQEQVTIKRSFSQEKNGLTQRAEPLKQLYVGLRPLHEILNQATPDGDGRQLGRECDRFLFRKVAGGQDPAVHVYWLDRDTGITLRHERYNNQEDHAQGHPDFVWNAQSLDEVDGHHLVRNSEVLMYHPNGPTPTRVMIQWRTTADEVVFNKEYPKTIFWPEITKQTRVIDTIANRMVFPKTDGKEVASTAEPIRAVEPVGWNLPLSTPTILLVVSVMGVGLAFYKRRG